MAQDWAIVARTGHPDQGGEMTVELYAMTCGHITLPSAFLLTKTRGWLTVPVPAYLIVHPKGKVLFDSGMNTLGQTDPVAYLGAEGAKSNVIDFKPGEEIATRLRALNVAPEDITHVVNSHLHYDHCGGNAQLPNADIVVQEKEWAWGCSCPHDNYGYQKGDFDTGQRVKRVQGEHDLFGDGTIVCVPTHGHTPGHQSLRVKAGRGEFVLCGDACYLRRSLDDLHLPGVVADRDAALRALHWFRDMQAQGHRIMYGHDPDFWCDIPQGPERLG
jgi:glyoxylase-like metal-dependent hydrolase (beta-lactamase superfamily II)